MRYRKCICGMRYIYSISIYIYIYSYYLKAVENRDETIGPGFFLNGEHYDVHRYHPPLVYGRRGGPEDGEGIAYCRVKSHVNGEFVHLVITYLLPILSPRAIPQMLEFSKKYSISYIYIYIY